MAAVIRVEEDTVADVVAAIDDVVVANVNAPGQVAIAGTEAAVASASDALREHGGRVIPLPVEGAFHSPAMTPAVVALTAALEWAPTRDPEVPLVSGLDAEARTTSPSSKIVMSVLTGLARRTVPDLTAVSVATPDDVPAALEAAAALREQAPANAA